MAANQTGDRTFKVGETIHLRTRISVAGTRTPTDATVTLTRLMLGAVPVTVTPTAFTRINEGDYQLVLHTDSLVPGAYDVVITISGGPDLVAIVTDRFALRSV